MKKRILKVVSIVLCLVITLSSMSLSALAAEIFTFDETVDEYYNVISKDDYDIAPGIKESEIVLNNDDGSRRQVLHFMEADINNPYTKVISSYTEMNTQKFQVSNMVDQATWIEDNWGWNVVGAMNTCLSWYNTAHYMEHPELINEPLGFMMVDGVIMNDEAVGFPTVLVIHYDEKDGEVRPANIPKVEMRTVKTMADLNGWEEQIIPCSSGFVLKDGVILSSETHSNNDAPRSVVGIKADGTVVIMMNDGRQSPYSAGMTMYEVAAAMKAAGCIHAVNCDGGGSSTFLSQRPGQELTVNCSPSDGALRSTTQGIVFVSTAPSTGEFVRANITTENEYYTPGSIVEFNALGTDLVGTTATIPDDVTWQIKEDGMGTISDGVFTSNGKVGTVTAQMIYNDEVVGEDSVEIVIPENLSFAQSVMTVPFGKDVTISLNATIHDGIHNVTLKPSDITFSTTNEALGSFDGFVFKSISEADAPENITSTITATLNCGEGISATATLSLGKGSEVLYDFEQDIDGWVVGNVNDRAEYNGEKVYDYDINHVTVTDGEVHDGNGSMHFYMNGIDQENTAGSYMQLAIYPEEDIIIENAKSIGAWIYVPDEFYNLWIRFHYYYENADGTYTKKNTVPVLNQPSVYNTIEESGWHYFSVDVSAYDSIMLKGASGKYTDAKDCRFIEFNACHMATNDIWTKLNGTLNGKYDIYVDSISVDYSDAVDDREAPVFNSVSLVADDAETAMVKHSIVKTKNNTLNITAKVSENTTKSNATGLDASSAKAYVDGVEVDCTYTNGKIAIADVKVADGVHRVKFEICDMMGNKSVVIRLVEVNSGVDASTVQLVPANSELDRLLGGSVYWMNLEATDIETIQSVTTTIDLNSSNHWELDHMVVNDDFTATYTIDEKLNTATITITRINDSEATGEAILAELPIRIIYYDTDINLEGYTAQTHWMNVNFWSHDLKVDVDMGEIEYVDDYTSDVLNVFSNEEFSVDTEWYTSGLNMDSAYKTEKGSSHVHTTVVLEDKAVSCEDTGYTDRTFCEVCNSVVDWGTEIPSTGHNYKLVDGEFVCDACNDVYNTGTGIFEMDGKKYYSIANKLITGWHQIGGEWYFFTEDDYAAATGTYMYMGFWKYQFSEDGKLLRGAFYTDKSGNIMYHYAGKYVFATWMTIDGEEYYFDKNCHALTGSVIKLEATSTQNYGLYNFTSDGRLVGRYTNTFVQVGDKLYYADENGLAVRGAFMVDGSLYYASGNNMQVLRGTIYAEAKHGNGFIDKDGYYFTDENGRFLNNEFYTNADGVSYFIENGCIKKGPMLIESNGERYYLQSDGSVTKNMSIVLSSQILGTSESAICYFDENGAMRDHEFYVVNGYIRYFIDGQIQYSGVVEENGNLYYVSTNNGRVSTGVVYIEAKYGNGLIDKDGYYFTDENGRFLNNEFYTNASGNSYYIENGSIKKGPMLIEHNGERYYLQSDGCVTKNMSMVLSSEILGTDKAGTCYFDENGAMRDNEFYVVNGYIRYFIDGQIQYSGVTKVDGKYYYISKNTGRVATGVYYVSESATNGLIEAGWCKFDETGAMIVGTPIK